MGLQSTECHNKKIHPCCRVFQLPVPEDMLMGQPTAGAIPDLQVPFTLYGALDLPGCHHGVGAGSCCGAGQPQLCKAWCSRTHTGTRR